MDRRFAFALATALAVAATLPAAASADDGPIVRIESVGGSRLVGTLKVKSIAIQADFGKVEVEPSKIKSVTLGGGDGDTIVTTSGSIIKGKISDDAFEIESEFGTIKLERSKLRSLTLAKDDPSPPEKPKSEPKLDDAGDKPKPGTKEAAEKDDRATRPRPIPRYITQPTALRVTKLPAGHAPIRVLSPFPRPLPVRYKSKAVLGSPSPMYLRDSRP